MLAINRLRERLLGVKVNMPKFTEKTRKASKEKRVKREERLMAKKTAREMDLEIKEEIKIKNEEIYRKRAEENKRIKEKRDARELVIQTIKNTQKQLMIDETPSLHRSSISNLKAKLEKLEEKKKGIEKMDSYISEIKPINKEDMQSGFSKNYVEYRNIIKSYEKIPYYENPACVNYSEYMKERVESIFNNITKVNSADKSVDFVLELDGKRLKVKHLTSCCIHMCLADKDRTQYGWEYNIDQNHTVDAFLLSAFDNRNSLNCLHLWLVLSKKTFGSVFNRLPHRKINKQLRCRKILRLRNSTDTMSYMDRFELKEELQKLKEFGYNNSKNEHKSLAHLLLLEKQQKIFEITGKKRGIEYLIERSIEIGFEKTQNYTNNTDGINKAVQKILKTRLRKDQEKKNGLKQEEYENEAYNLVIEKQKELLDTTGNLKSIKEIVDECIESGICEMNNTI
jgi:hypothetical protein